MTVFLFVCSIVLLMVGHALRLMRWSCFIKIYEHPPAGALLRSMALGYALNFFVPFKLGDVFRAYYSGKRMKNGIGFSLATVILDRFLDLIVVALLFAVLAFSNVGRDAARESRALLLYRRRGARAAAHSEQLFLLRDKAHHAQALLRVQRPYQAQGRALSGRS